MRIKINIISSIFILMITFVGLTTDISSASSLREEVKLKDANGQVLKTGKKYYIEPKHFKNRGLTFEVYNNWDYVLASNERKDDNMYGTPVQLFIENTNEKEGLDITTEDQLVIKMVNHNWAGYKYFSFTRTSGYVYLNNKGTTVTLEQDTQDNGIAINAGALVTKYYDSFGRPTGKLLAKTKKTNYTYFQVFPTGQVFSDPNKLWLIVYMNMNTNTAKPEFLFKAVD